MQLASRRRSREAAQALTLAAMGARGKPEAVRKAIRDFDRADMER